jgi:triacylglycerol lipase
MALNARTTKHSFANALAMAELSEIAYRDIVAIRTGIEQAVGGTRSLKEFKFIDNPATHTQAFMAGFDDAIVLSFRGTEHLQDWIQDAQLVLVPFRQVGLVHIGFRNAIDSVYPEIESTLREWAGQGRTLWITGHSLGGALAMMAAAYLRFPADPTKTLPHPLAGLYTFGQPRTGTVTFCQACDGNFGTTYFRYINNEDIVTRIPPRELAYWHGGKDFYIDRNGAVHEDPAWWHVFLDRVVAGAMELRNLQVAQPHIGLIADHAIGDYAAAIRKVVAT